MALEWWQVLIKNTLKYSNWRAISGVVSLILWSMIINAQMSIDGFVLDAVTGEALNGAHIYTLHDSSSHITDELGYFSLHVVKPSKQVRFIVSYVGYQVDTFSVHPSRDSLIYIKLRSGLLLNEIEVVRAVGGRNTDRFIQLQTSETTSLPSLTGQTDVLKAFQLLPGVSGGLEGNGGLYVRGGSPDQNLILLDGTPLYYAYHLGGFISTFDPNSIKNTTLYHDYIPSKYSGRLSSVVDVRLKDGGKDRWRKDLNVGLLATSFSANGPLSEKLTISFSVRRTLYDLLANAYLKYIDRQDFTGGYFIFDAHTKLTLSPNPKNRFQLSFYSGLDKSFVRDQSKDIVFREFPDEPFKAMGNNTALWGNTVLALSWNLIPSGSWTFDIFGKYAHFFLTNRSLLDVRSDSRIVLFNDQKLQSKINDFEVSARVKRYFRNDLRSELGVSANLRHFTPFSQTFQLQSEFQTSDTIYSDGTSRSPEFKFYNEWTWDNFIKNFSVKSGASLSLFSIPTKNYWLLDPRFILTYERAAWSLSASYMRLHQFLHFLSNSSNGFPADLWVPSTANVAPQRSSQIWLGAKRSHKSLELSLGIFFKEFNDLIRLRAGEGFFRPGALSTKILDGGGGRAQGLEFLAKKKLDRVNGWIAYTISRNERRFMGFNNNQWFPYLYDRRHDISLVLQYDLSQSITFGGTWIYQSGHPLTFPNFRYLLQTDDLTDRFQNFSRLTTIYDVTAANNVLSRPAHRLDISFEFKRKKGKSLNTWKVGIYNLYNRRNPYYYYIQRAPENGIPQLKQVSIFPILPFFNFHKSW